MNDESGVRLVQRSAGKQDIGILQAQPPAGEWFGRPRCSWLRLVTAVRGAELLQLGVYEFKRSDVGL